MSPIPRRLLAAALIIGLLALVTPTAAAPNRQDSHITYGDVVRGSVTENASEQLWQFTGQAGDTIVIDMRADNTSALDSYLTLNGPLGVTLMTDDDSGGDVNARIGPYILPDDGDYSIYASSYSGTGDYSLSLENLATRPALALGKPLTGHATPAYPSEYFLLTPGADEGDTLLRLDATDDDPYSDPILALYGPDGLIADMESSVDTGVLDPIAVRPGQTYVIAVSWNSSGGGGPYTLNLSHSEITLLEDAIAQEGRLGLDVETQDHFFCADAGQTVSVTVSTLDSLPLGLAIQSADSTSSLFYSDGSSARAVVAVVEIPASGVYRVSVSDTQYSQVEGSYTVMVETVAE